MSHTHRVILLTLVGIGLVVCMVIPGIGFAEFNVLHKESATVLPVATSTPVPTVISGTATAAPVCSGPPAMYILLIGSDTRSDDYYAGLADSIRIVRADFVHPGLIVLPFQRDLYVEIPGISSHAGITHGKLERAYFYGNPGVGYYDGPGQGPGLLSATLQQNFGARVDHYVAVNPQTFVRVVDALGGIDIDLPSAVDARSSASHSRDLYFPAGKQHLDGARAQTLARVSPDGEMQRTARQDLLLKALAARILSPSSLPQMPKLVEAFYASVQTDMGAGELARLLCLGSMIAPQQIQSVDFPAQLFTSSRVKDPVVGYTFTWNVDFNMLRRYVQYFNEGTWPQTPLAAP
jgi:LCP family protein required for cell wall assembly